MNHDLSFGESDKKIVFSFGFKQQKILKRLKFEFFTIPKIVKLDTLSYTSVYEQTRFEDYIERFNNDRWRQLKRTD